MGCGMHHRTNSGRILFRYHYYSWLSVRATMRDLIDCYRVRISCGYLLPRRDAWYRCTTRYQLHSWDGEARIWCRWWGGRLRSKPRGAKQQSRMLLLVSTHHVVQVRGLAAMWSSYTLPNCSLLLDSWRVTVLWCFLCCTRWSGWPISSMTRSSRCGHCFIRLKAV